MCNIINVKYIGNTSVVLFTNPPILTWHLHTYNILSWHPPLTLGAEVQLCWLLPLTLEPSAQGTIFPSTFSPDRKVLSKFENIIEIFFLQMKHN